MDSKELLNFVKTKKRIGDLAGTNRRRISCPFCRSKEQDMQLYHDANKFRCWNGSCNVQGSTIDWVMLQQNVSIGDAVKFLANSMGIEVAARDDRSEVLEKVTRSFQKALKKNTDVVDYWETRGIDYDTLYRYRVGYCSDEVLREIVGLPYNQDQVSWQTLEDCELYKYGKSAFRNHTIFPYRHYKNGKVVQVQGRVVGEPKENESRWKCLATHSKLGSRNLNAMLWGEEELYRYGSIVNSKGQTYSFLLEGIPDALTLRQREVHAMSFVGNQNLKQHVWKMRKLDQIYLVMDNEKSSQDNLPWELYDILLDTPSTEIVVVTLPNLPGLNEKGNPIKQDVNDFFNQGATLHDLKKIVDASPTATSYLIDSWGQDENKYQLLLEMIHERTEEDQSKLINQLSMQGLFTVDQMNAFVRMMKIDRRRKK